MHIADDKIVIILDDEEAKQMAIALRLAAFFAKKCYPTELMLNEYEASLDGPILERLSSIIFRKAFPEAFNVTKTGG